MKPFIIFLSISVLLFLQSCSSEEKAPSVDVYEIRNIGLLSTSEYTIGKVVKLDDNKEWYKFGDRKILISCKAKVKAGINLMELKDSSIHVNGSKITIELPPVQITVFEMDPTSVHTEMEDINGFRADFSQTDKNRILRLGEKSIREHLEETGIKKEAEKNAIAFITDFYKQLGFEEIDVELSKAELDEK
jgi:hypothetical protein